MKLTHLFTSLLLCLSLFSCIRDEAANAEADILACTVPADILKRDPLIENNKITLMVKADTDLAAQDPEFTLTPGATIVPANGSKRDFSTPQYYTVTSEDGQWSKQYQVIYVVAGLSTYYSFENAERDKKNNYIDFNEKNESGNVIMTWASGNSGFALTGMGTNPSNFPTDSSHQGKDGYCLKLTTCDTGYWGGQLGMPIAAGNLFMGTFSMADAITNALKATKFGFPFEYTPTYLTGYYKFKSGDVFTKNGVPIVPNKKDMCDIYAIFYETDDEVKMLDGTNQFSHPNLISVARIDNQEETDEWTQFYIPFISKPGKMVDKDKLKAGMYNVAIVFSSSIEGDRFYGAVGSTLYVDEVELIYSVNK